MSQDEMDEGAVIAKLRAHIATGKSVVVFYVGEAGQIEVDFMCAPGSNENETKKMVARAAYETYALKDDNSVH